MNLYLLKERLKNVSLWLKIVVFIVSSFAFVMITITYIGQDVIMKQNGEGWRTNKIKAANLVLQYEAEGLEKFLLGLADSLVRYKFTENTDSGREFLNSKKEILATLYDLNFVAYLDAKETAGCTWVRNNQKVIQLSELKALKEIDAYKSARKGISIADLQTLNVTLSRLLIGEIAQDTRLVQLVAVPVVAENTIEGVLIAGRDFSQESAVVKQISKQLNVGVGFYHWDKLVAAYNDGRNHQLVPARLEGETYKKVLLESQRYAGEEDDGAGVFLTVAEPLKNNSGEIIGALMLYIPKEPLMAMKDSYLVRISLLGVIMLLLFYIGMTWLHGEISRPLQRLIKQADRLARGELQVTVEAEETPDCWRILNCHKNQCPAYGKKDMRCWFVGGTQCENRYSGGVANKLASGCCIGCKMFTFYKGNELRQLADVFNYMAHSLGERDQQLLMANTDLKNQNTSLEAQQQELIAQKESLILLNRELEKTMQQLEKSENIVYTLALAVEAKDHYTRGHSERVACYATKMAEALDMQEDELRTIIDAAILHDVGKIGINDMILTKPGALTDEEYTHVKHHPALGEKICQPLSSAHGLLPIIRHHHEFYNGKGYPDGRAREEIPLGARILAIADAFDAMTSDRPYRKGMPVLEALAIIKEGAGSQWDPELVKVFEKLVVEGQCEEAAAAKQE